MRARLFQFGILAALAAAAFLMYLAFDTGRDEEPVVRRDGIVRVFPQPNTVVLRQEPIGVELAFGYTAVIYIDRTRIPEDQVDVQAGINRFSFTPGQGKEISRLDEGRHCARIEYSSTSTEGTSAVRTYSWCFNAA
ncbi:MAG TPA: hypothetical protein VM345_06145 [Acidimicrobiales bacterium]|nr:hypothetical protein [Acidimicrobiales bacterium]